MLTSTRRDLGKNREYTHTHTHTSSGSIDSMSSRQNLHGEGEVYFQHFVTLWKILRRGFNLLIYMNMNFGLFLLDEKCAAGKAT